MNLPAASRASWAVVKKLGYYSYTLPKSASRLRYQSNAAFFFEICANPIYFEKFVTYNLSTRESVMRANNSLVDKSLSEEDRLESVLGIGFEVASRLLKKFWRPRRVIQRVVDNYVNSRFNGFFMIGIHLRYQYISDNDIMLFADCALQIEKQVLINFLFIFNIYFKNKFGPC